MYEPFLVSNVWISLKGMCRSGIASLRHRRFPNSMCFWMWKLITVIYRSLNTDYHRRETLQPTEQSKLASLMVPWGPFILSLFSVRLMIVTGKLRLPIRRLSKLTNRPKHRHISDENMIIRQHKCRVGHPIWDFDPQYVKTCHFDIHRSCSWCSWAPWQRCWGHPPRLAALHTPGPTAQVGPT